MYTLSQGDCECGKKCVEQVMGEHVMKHGPHGVFYVKTDCDH